MVENDFHWHDFDAVTYIVSGELNVERQDTGEKYALRAGDKAVAKSGVVHRERHAGVRAVFGLSVPPSELTMPIDKSPELLRNNWRTTSQFDGAGCIGVPTRAPLRRRAAASASAR